MFDIYERVKRISSSNGSKTQEFIDGKVNDIASFIYPKYQISWNPKKKQFKIQFKLVIT